MREVRFDAGDEVLLDGDALAIALMANSAVRGVVVASHGGSTETGYSVRFPGRLGVVRLPADVLLPAMPFEPIRLGPRHTASTLHEAVDILAMLAARLVRCRARGEVPDRMDILDCRTLAAAVEQRCHMLPGQILDQIAPKAACLLGTRSSGDRYLAHPASIARHDITVAAVPFDGVPYAAARRGVIAGTRTVRSQPTGAR